MNDSIVLVLVVFRGSRRTRRIGPRNRMGLTRAIIVAFVIVCHGNSCCSNCSIDAQSQDAKKESVGKLGR